MVISNHFLCKDWVHHPIDSQPFISMVGWPWGSRLSFIKTPFRFLNLVVLLFFFGFQVQPSRRRRQIFFIFPPDMGMESLRRLPRRSPSRPPHRQVPESGYGEWNPRRFDAESSSRFFQVTLLGVLSDLFRG